MREQLIQYVRLLFAGTADTDEIQQEILQNTLDKYDDLISQGKSPEAAYRLAISGIGDINEILSKPTAAPVDERATDSSKAKLLRSISVALYILCAIPVILFDGSNIGVCLTLIIVAVATALIIIAGKNKQAVPEAYAPKGSFPPRKENSLRKAIHSILWAVGTCFYFVLSFATSAWYITWLVFLILPAMQGLINAIMDLKEAM